MNTTPSQQRILDAISNLQRAIEYDTYYLTGGDRDSLFYRLERFRDEINGLYRKRIPQYGY